MIEIVRASAGSGKTFKLAKTYIGLLLRSDDRYAYRHILAVTFTNKATEEMKSRILKELDILARTPEKSPYHDDFIVWFDSDEAMSEKAENILFDILHDYSAFSVSTIDKFFQTTLKSFAREIGQFSTYQVELDKDSLVKETVDRILDSLIENEKSMLSWLRDSAMAQLEMGNKANVEGILYDMAIALKSESHRDSVEKYALDEEKMYSRENLKAVRTAFRKYKTSFVDRVRQGASKIIEIFDNAGVPVSSTYKGFASKLYFYANCKPNGIPMLTDTFLNKGKISSQWFSKDAAKKYLHLLEDTLAEPFNAFIELFEKEFKVYETVCVLESQLYGLGIASEFNKGFLELMKEKNVINIDDSNSMLKKIIDGTDAPFIYEKLGVRYNNFLLDEFQDTSAIQWENFKPLIKESDSNGHDGLIVGDVKQSIYRWRGSDWNLLAEQVKKEFPNADDDKPLADNWRSLDRIVKFNSNFFPYASKLLDEMSGSNMGIASIYADVNQNTKVGQVDEGMIDFTFCDKNNELEEVLSSIMKVTTEGNAGYGQIAVVVRTNNEGAAVASYLIEHDIPVVSDDSLNVKASVTVRRLVSLMHFVDNPEDKINAYMAESLGIECPSHYHSLFDLAENLLRKMSKVFPDIFESDVLYIQSFMDTIQEWSATNGNNLNAFLKYWDEKNIAISSPQAPDSVRIITIHKAKGLEYPYVIFPFVESVNLNKQGKRWCRPAIEGTCFPEVADGLYHVNLSEKSKQTLFASDYKKEQSMQFVDNLNVLYVGLTRAEKGLSVIGSLNTENKKNMAHILYAYLTKNQQDFEYTEEEVEDKAITMRFHQGEMPDFRKQGKKSEIYEMPSKYLSFPLNSEEGDLSIAVGERGRLKFSTDAIDFFMDSGEVPRLKGIVLHDILSSVLCPSDLDKAVEEKYRHGYIDKKQAKQYYDMLSERISSVKSKGWFPEDRTLVDNEQAIIDVDGQMYRPDRVVINGDSVMIIDYKFGEEKSYYLKQIRKYSELYRSMGYADVRACLWYVYENKIVYL